MRDYAETLVRDYCLSLPDAEPPAALWDSLLKGRQRQRRLNHARNAGIILALLLPLVAFPLLRDTAEPAKVAAPTPSRVAPHPELRAIDQELQAAYTGGASDQELAALWARRVLYQTAGDDIKPLSL